VPTLLKKAGFLDQTMDNVKLGQEMALGYMAMTSARDTYGSFMEAGADRQTAGIAAIASMLALNTLMRQDYFRKTLFKGSFFDEDTLKSTVEKWFESTRTAGMKIGAQYMSAAIFGVIRKHTEKAGKVSLNDYKRMTAEIIKIISVQLQNTEQNDLEKDASTTTEEVAND
jgi:hypothetical protein